MIAVTQEDRELCVKFFAETLPDTQGKVLANLRDTISDGSRDEMPMMQIVAFVRRELQK